MNDFRTLTLRQRLDEFPPFLCLALSRVKTEKLTKEQIKSRFSGAARRKRDNLRRAGRPKERKQLYRRMTLEEVIEKSGVPGWYVREKLARLTSWNTVQIDDALRFMDACGIDLTHIARNHSFIRRNAIKNKAFWHLTSQQKAELAERLKEWKRVKSSAPEP
jgi:hypothetical protein